MAWNYLLALDAAYILPLTTVSEALAQKTSEQSAVAGAHVAAFVALVVAAVYGSPSLILASLAVCATAGALTATPRPSRWTTAVSLVSPLSYVTAWPLWLSHVQPYRLVALAINVTHLVTAAGLVLLSAATRLHLAWGCYPASTPLSHYDLGMCGDNSRWFPPAADVCSAPGVKPNCAADGSPYRFFGSTFQFVVHAQAIALAVWFLAGLTLLDEPKTQSDKQPPAAIKTAFFM